LKKNINFKDFNENEAALEVLRLFGTQVPDDWLDLGLGRYQVKKNELEEKEDESSDNEQDEESENEDEKQNIKKGKTSSSSTPDINDDIENEAYYRVLSWPNALHLRKTLGLASMHFHITIGYKVKDIHDVKKDKQTLLSLQETPTSSENKKDKRVATSQGTKDKHKEQGKADDEDKTKNKQDGASTRGQKNTGWCRDVLSQVTKPKEETQNNRAKEKDKSVEKEKDQRKEKEEDKRRKEKEKEDEKKKKRQRRRKT